jgi:hypothetical protein
MGMKGTLWRRASALLLLGTLTGCAAYEWTKAGASRQQIMKDEELCERHAEAIRRPARPGMLSYGLTGYYSPPPGEEAEVTQRFFRCMEARGYERVKR